MSLTSLPDMKDYLGIDSGDTTHDTFLQGQLDTYSSTVENYCGRKIEAADYVQTFYYSDFAVPYNMKLPMYHYPINTVASIKKITSRLGVDVETVDMETYQYRTNSKQGHIERIECGLKANWFCCDPETRIEVTFNGGYTTVPLEIDSVIKSLVSETYNKQKAGVDLNFGNDVQRIAIPGTISIDFDYTLQANERKVKFGMLLGNYINVLDYFRSERAIIGEVRNSYVA